MKYKVVELKDIEIVITNSIGIPIEFKEDIFKVEKETFSKTYKRCPQSMAEFDLRYENKPLYSIICLLQKEIIAFRLFEKLNNYQVQSMFMVVLEKYRGNGIADLLCALSYQYFKNCSYHYITSWTHIEITASKILAKYAPYISTNDDLLDEEIELLNNYEISVNKDKGEYGKKRLVKDFYSMIDQRKGDAYFWVHKLK